MPKIGGDYMQEPQTLYDAIKKVNKAWLEFITLLAEELGIYKILDFIENKLNSYRRL